MRLDSLCGSKAVWKHVWEHLILLQPLRWHCIECGINHEQDVREE